jgi:ligand-binding sensor domain-containing protein
MLLNEKLWIGTQGGLCSYSPIKKQFKTYFKGWQSNFIRHDDKLWTLNGDILSYIDTKQDSVYAVDTLNFKSIYVNLVTIKDGYLYFTIDGYLSRYDFGSKKLEPLDKKIKDIENSAFYADNKLYISTTSSILKTYDLEHHSFVDHNPGSGVNQGISYISNFYQMKSGELWAVGDKVYKSTMIKELNLTTCRKMVQSLVILHL